MTPADVFVVLWGTALLAAILGLAWRGLRGGRLLREQRYRLECPRLGKVVDCEIVQDLRNGQWKRVTACSVFEDPQDVTCEQDCRKQANLGYQLPQIQGS